MGRSGTKRARRSDSTSPRITEFFPVKRPRSVPPKVIVAESPALPRHKDSTFVSYVPETPLLPLHATVRVPLPQPASTPVPTPGPAGMPIGACDPASLSFPHARGQQPPEQVAAACARPFVAPRRAASPTPPRSHVVAHGTDCATQHSSRPAFALLSQGSVGDERSAAVQQTSAVAATVAAAARASQPPGSPERDLAAILAGSDGCAVVAEQRSLLLASQVDSCSGASAAEPHDASAAARSEGLPSGDAGRQATVPTPSCSPRSSASSSSSASASALPPLPPVQLFSSQPTSPFESSPPLATAADAGAVQRAPAGLPSDVRELMRRVTDMSPLQSSPAALALAQCVRTWADSALPVSQRLRRLSVSSESVMQAPPTPAGVASSEIVASGVAVADKNAWEDGTGPTQLLEQSLSLSADMEVDDATLLAAAEEMERGLGASGADNVGNITGSSTGSRAESRDGCIAGTRAGSSPALAAPTGPDWDALAAEALQFLEQDESGALSDAVAPAAAAGGPAPPDTASLPVSTLAQAAPACADASPPMAAFPLLASPNVAAGALPATSAEARARMLPTAVVDAQPRSAPTTSPAPALPAVSHAADAQAAEPPCGAVAERYATKRVPVAAPAQSKASRLGEWRREKGGGTYYVALSGRRLVGNDARTQAAVDKRTLQARQAHLAAIAAGTAPAPVPAIAPSVAAQEVQSEHSRALASWVPEAVAQAYATRGVQELHAWQLECLVCNRGAVLGGANLVYSAPTSGGKTLVAEVLMLRSLLSTGRKALFVLPYVSLAAEKTEALQTLWAPANLVITGMYGAKGAATLDPRADVAVCTIEKANSLTNRLLDEKRVQELGMVVVDEVHMVGDPHRGYLLELLLTKLLLVAGTDIQLVCMSATLPTLTDLATWLRASLYVTHARPVPLHEHVCADRTMYACVYGPGGAGVSLQHMRRLEHTKSTTCSSPLRSASSPLPLDLGGRSPLMVGTVGGSAPTRRHVLQDIDGWAQLVCESLVHGHCVLVFCESKAACDRAASFVAGWVPAWVHERYAVSCGQSRPAALTYGAEAEEARAAQLPPLLALQRARAHLVEELRQTPAGLCPVLEECVPHGVAYHHAGLTMEERRVVEHGFRSGTLCVLVATSTLAAGVNLPARRVIFRTPYVGRSLLDATKYRQMAGRAGRAGHDAVGESFLMVKQTDLQAVVAMLNSGLQPLESCLAPARRGMQRALLEEVACGLVRSWEEAKDFACHTLLAAQQGQPAAIAAVEDALRSLLAWNVVDCQRAMASAGAHPGATTAVLAVAAPCGAPTSSSGAATPFAVPSAASNAASATTTATVAAPAGPAAAAASSSSLLTVQDKLASVLASATQSLLAPTPLGKAAFFSSLDPADALQVYADLSRAREGMCMDSDLHLLYQVTPVYHGILPDWRRFFLALNALPAEALRAAEAVGVSAAFVQRAISSTPKAGEPPAVVHTRFYAALVLSDLVAERSVRQVSEEYRVPRGTLQTLQATAATFCGMVVAFCRHLNWPDLAALLAPFEDRLSFGAKPELLPLLAIPGLTSARARALYAAGLRTASSVLEAGAARVRDVLMAMHSFKRGEDAGLRRVVATAAAEQLCAAAEPVALGEQQQQQQQRQRLQRQQRRRRQPAAARDADA